MSFRFAHLFASSPGAVRRKPQRWARAACWIAFFSPLPSACWRTAMLAGADTGFAEAGVYRSSASGVLCVLLLDALQVGTAALSLGLCCGWGEKVPKWVPRLGGKAVHRGLAATVGGAEALCLYFVVGVITVRVIGVSVGLWEGWTPIAGMNSTQRAILVAAYGPTVLWPLILTVGLVGYWRRRGRRSVLDVDPVSSGQVNSASRLPPSPVSATPEA